MMSYIRLCVITLRKWPLSCLGLVLSITLGCLLLARGTSASKALDMPPEPPAAGAQEPITPIPLSVALDPQRVALGERLFHDVRLSHDNTRACATCHPLQRGGMDGHPRAITADGTLHPRNTPTIFNVGLNASLNWDGIATTLEAHAEIVLLHPSLMNTTWPELLAKLQADADYVTRFNTAYAAGLTPANVLDALASFERSLLTPNARFDRYLRGELQALTAPEQQGYRLFKSYGCVACHQGINIGGNMYQKFGIFEETGDGESPAALVDLGRYAVTKVARDRAVFRVPSLRNVAVTAPYFHDGRAATLEDAVETMAQSPVREDADARGDCFDRAVPADPDRRISRPGGGDTCRGATVMGMSNVWKPLSIVSSLLLLLTYLLIQSRSPDLALRARMQEALQILHLHDTELTRDVLLARAGLLPHYDSLPRTGQSLSRTLGTLRAESDTVSGHGGTGHGPARRRPGGRTAPEADLGRVLHVGQRLAAELLNIPHLRRANPRPTRRDGAGGGCRHRRPVARDAAVHAHAGASVGQEARGSAPAPGTYAPSRRISTRWSPMGGSLWRCCRRSTPCCARSSPPRRRPMPLPCRMPCCSMPTGSRRVRNVFRVLLYLVAVILLGYLLYQFVRLRANARALRRANADLQQEMGERQQAVDRLARQRRTLPGHHGIGE